MQKTMSVPFCNQDNVKAFFAAAAVAANHSNNNNNNSSSHTTANGNTSNGNNNSGANQSQPPQALPPQQLYQDQLPQSQQPQFGAQTGFESHPIPNQMMNRDSSPFYLINQKLSHLNLNDGCDLNGNSPHHQHPQHHSHHPHPHSQSGDLLLGNPNHLQQHPVATGVAMESTNHLYQPDNSTSGQHAAAYFPDSSQIGPQNGDEMQHFQQNYHHIPPTNTMNLWNVDFVQNNLRNKLGAIKQIQHEVQSSYVDGQNQFTNFINQCRIQLNTVYAELSEELDQHFKSRMIEMSQQQNQIEDILYRIEQKQLSHKSTNNNGGSNKGGNGSEDCSNLLNLFDSEFVGFVKNILDCSISADDFRLPNVDSSLIDRSIRSLMFVLFNKLTSAHPLYGQYGYSTAGGAGGSYGGPPMAALPTHQTQSNSTGSAVVIPSQHSHHHQNHHQLSSSNSESDNNNFVPETMPGTYAMSESNMHLPAMNNSMGPMFANCWPANMMPTNSQQATASNKQTIAGISSGNGYPTMVDLNRANFSNNNNNNGTSSNNATNSNTAGSNTPFYPYLNNDDINSHYYNSTGFNGTGNGPNLSQQQKQILNKSLQPKIRRERMTYFCKFGEQGTLEGQFAEPSGVAVNVANSDIFIADANNHRIQVFDKWGKFKFHFGEGKLKFPNRVAISRISGEIVVSERPPVHQIQVYNKSGNFLCKFGSKHLRHPRGLTVDHKNRVVVVECKVMRVFIFNLRGDLLHSFDCSQQIQFPNAVVVSKKEEIFISDNRNHCVKVFSFAGEFLRQIGGQGITNYPIGVCLNESNGQLLVIDNYNNLNVTMFRTDGQLTGAFESSVKHQQCLDVAMLGESSIVVTSKDLQVYIYRLKDCSNANNISSSSGGSSSNNSSSVTNGNNNNGGGVANHHNSSSNGNNNNSSKQQRQIVILNSNSASGTAAAAAAPGSSSNHSNNVPNGNNKNSNGNNNNHHHNNNGNNNESNNGR